MIEGQQSNAVGRPKVLVVMKRLDVGGTEKHITQIIPQLCRHGIDVSLFVLERGGKLESAILASGVSIAPAAASRRMQFGVIRKGWHLYRHIRRHRPDLVHFFLPEPYLIGSFAAILAGIDGRIMSRRSLAHYQDHHRIFARVEICLHRRTRALLGNSTAVVDELVRECQDCSKVGLIYNGITVPAQPDAGTRQRIRQSLGIPADCLVLTIVANLIGYKGHDDLLQALAFANSGLPRDWRLLVVGRDDGLGDALIGQAGRLGLDGNVVWMGERDDVERIFAATDIAILSSHQEGFSNSLIEAMGCGLPVIATAVGGNLDAVVDEETGLLVPVNAPQALAAAIVKLARDAALRAQFGTSGRKRAESQFSLETAIRRYVNLYKDAKKLGRVPVNAILEQAIDPIFG